MAVHPVRHDPASVTRLGFTLVEMSIVLIIMSVVVGGGFALATNINERKKEDVTQARLDAIEKALLDYRKANNRLPCPADGSLNPDHANYGIEAANSGSCTGGTPTANFTGATHATKTVYTDTTVVGGTIPIVTLGLPKEYGIDGWGNKFSYHIDARATEHSAFSTYTISNSNCFNVIIDDALTWANDSDRNYLSFHAVYALISHGKDGHGAFSMGGPRINSGTVNAFQQQNAHYDDTGMVIAYNNLFHVVPESEDPDTPRDRFDDILRFKTRAQLRTVQDGPGIIFPDLILSSSYSTANQKGTRFMYRCGDDFLLEAMEMVDINNKRVKRVAVSPNNTYILGAMETDYHFRMWTYDGVKTTMLPDSAFDPYPNIASGTTENVAWSEDGEFFLVSAMDGTDYPNRVSIYERTGVNQFTRVDAAVENATNSNGHPVLNAGSLWGLNLRPDGNELIIMYGVVDDMLPMLYERNPDNTFTYVGNSPAEMPEKKVIRPIWSDDSNYLIIIEEAANVIYLFRNEGNHAYSRIPDLSPMPTTKPTLAAFSPDGRFLVLANETDNEVRFYELNNRDEYVALPTTPTPTPRATHSLQFSRDGKYLAVGKFRDSSANKKNLYIYKIEGNIFTLLNDDPDIRIESPDGTLMYAEWRQLMPWEKE